MTMNNPTDSDGFPPTRISLVAKIGLKAGCLLGAIVTGVYNQHTQLISSYY
jgi:hypothetical protein